MRRVLRATSHADVLEERTGAAAEAALLLAEAEAAPGAASAAAPAGVGEAVFRLAALLGVLLTGEVPRLGRVAEALRGGGAGSTCQGHAPLRRRGAAPRAPARRAEGGGRPPGVRQRRGRGRGRGCSAARLGRASGAPSRGPTRSSPSTWRTRGAGRSASPRGGSWARPRPRAPRLPGRSRPCTAGGRSCS